MSKRSLVAVAGLLLLAACADPSTAPGDLVNGSNPLKQQNPGDPCHATVDPLYPQPALKTAAARVPSCPVQ